MRKTNPEEIEQLYEFTRRHYVEYYDVQTELVDHLASAMEKNWEQEQQLSFEENLQREFSKFGVFGFMEVVERKSNAMGKRYFRLIWREMRQQLLDARVVFSGILIFTAIIFLLRYQNFALITSAAALYFGVLWFQIIKSFKVLKRKKRSGQRIFLLESAILNTISYFQFTYLPFQILYLNDLDLSINLVQIAVALFFVFMIFASYICIYVLPLKRDEILTEYYPELKF